MGPVWLYLLFATMTLLVTLGPVLVLRTTQRRRRGAPADLNSAVPPVSPSPVAAARRRP